MKDAFVVDSSVGISWVHVDQATNATDELLRRVESGALVIVPALWFLEMANGLLMLQRRRRMEADERTQALAMLAALQLSVDDEASSSAFGAISELAERYRLSVYDATYLELAQRRGLPLATRDAPMRAAARKCRVPTL